MTPEQLKASILQLAIQGKLVPQRPDEGTAEEFYQQIQREKKKLTAAGKLKKEKPLPPISEDEIPFDIPESWKWVRLGEIAKVLGGKRIPAGRRLTIENTGHIYIRVSDMKDGSVSMEKLQYVPCDIYQSISKYVIQKEDVYITVAGTIGRVGKIPAQLDGANLTENADRLIIKEINQDWFIYSLSSFCVQEQIANCTTKVGQPKLAIKRIEAFLIPLPPLAEQQRIVEKIEQMLPLVEQYGEAYTVLESLDARFPDDMRKSILQYAIQGKLVPQRPEEGTAEELYQQIQKEKKKLNAAGKLKKEKPLPPITEEEIPFDIPDSWKWVHMGDIFAHNTGKAQNSTAETRNGILRKFITTSNVYWNRFDFSKVKEMLFTENEIEKCTVQKGDLLVCEGGDCGRAAIWQDDESMCIQNHIHRLRPYVGVEIMFFYYVFWLLKQTGYLNGKGVGIKGLSSNTLHKLPCPLPPLKEQRRIVEKMVEIPPIIS